MYGALGLCAASAVRLFSTPTVNIRDAVTTTALVSTTTLRYNIAAIHGGCWTRFLLWFGCAFVEHKGRKLQFLFLTDIFGRFIYSQ
jgi:hypothetical protein